MKIKRLHEKAILPHYVTEGSSAFDLFCYEEPEWKWNANEYWTTIIDTGWAFEVPKEHGMFILSRSGHGFRADTTLSNSIGLLDEDFVLEAKVKLICYDINHPNIKAGQAVAQAVILHTPRQYFEVVDKLKEPVQQHLGFGSTDEEKK